MSKRKNRNKKSTPQPVAISKEQVVMTEVEPPQNPAEVGVRSIVITALILVLMLAGIGLLVFGLLNNTQQSATQTAGNATIADPLTADTVSDMHEQTGRVSSITTDEQQDNQTGEREAINMKPDKFPQTSSTYSRGNTYLGGELTGASYTVKRGDTLWQIAQGRYGSGYAWVEIAKANGGFPLLRSGKPALVLAGRELVLPEL